MKKHRILSVLMMLCSVMFLVPIFLLLVQACSPLDEAMRVAQGMATPKLWPSSFSLHQFATLFFSYQDFWERFLHDLLWSVTISLVQVFLSVINGYILAKYQNKLLSLLTVLFTLTMMIPMQMFLIPTYRMAQGVGLLNRSIILYMPLAFFPLGTILMRQINLKVPDDWIEYHRLEGGGFLQLLFYVILPHCAMSALILFVLSFVECWGMVEQPLILLTNKASYPLSMLLYDMRVSQPQIIYAASVVTLVPIGAFFLLGLLMLYVRKKSNKPLTIRQT